MTEDSPVPVTVDPIPEPVPEPAVDAPITPKPVLTPKRSGGGMALLGGVLAAVVGFGVAQLVPNGWPLGNLAATETQVAAQAKEIADLKAALAKPVPDAALADRVAALESSAAPDVTGLEPRLATLEAQIAALPASGAATDPAALTALQAEVDALKASGGPLPAAVAEMTKALDEKLAACTDARHIEGKEVPTTAIDDRLIAPTGRSPSPGQR